LAPAPPRRPGPPGAAPASGSEAGFRPIDASMRASADASGLLPPAASSSATRCRHGAPAAPAGAAAACSAAARCSASRAAASGKPAAVSASSGGSACGEARALS